MATVVPLVHVDCHSKSVFQSLDHQSSCQRASNSWPSTPCLIDRFVFLACFRALHFVKAFLPFLAVLFTFLFLPLPLPLPGLLLVVSSVPGHPLVWWFCKYCVSFDNFPPCNRKFHTMKSVLGNLILTAHRPQILRYKLCVSSY